MLNTFMRKILILLFPLLVIGFARTSYALTVSPAKIEVAADPGQTITGKIEIFNEQAESKTFYTSYENFESRGSSGAPYFIGADKGLATWIQTDSEVSVASGERLPVPYTITVPSNAKPGGYFAAVFFGSQTQQGTSGGEVTIGGKIGVLVLLRVNGEVEESAGLVDFNAEEGKKFFSTLPIILNYKFNNAGGDRVVPKGEINIKNTFRVSAVRLSANEREGSVLPGSTRQFDVAWSSDDMDSKKEVGFFGQAMGQLKDFHFGWYTANLDISWGGGGETASDSFSFFIVPWQLLLIVVAIIAVVKYGVKGALRRYRRSIIAEISKQKR